MTVLWPGMQVLTDDGMQLSAHILYYTPLCRFVR